MALNNRALGVLAFIATGLAGWSVLEVATPAVQLRRRSAEEQASVRALSDSVYRLGLQVRTTRLRDLVDSVMKAAPPGAGPSVMVIGDEAPAAAALAESLYATLPNPDTSSYPMRLAIVQLQRPTPWPAGMLASFAMLPSSQPGALCATVALVFPQDSVLNRYPAAYWRDTPFGGAAGPCWFLARFGTPGPQVRAWLDARYWDVAAGIPPTGRRMVERDDDLSRAGLFDRVFGQVAAKFYGESVTLEGCAGRRPELCEAAFLETPYPPGLLPQGIVGNSRFAGYMRFRDERSVLGSFAMSGATLGVPHVASQRLLAMMVDDLGPDRFGAFWTSPAPVAEAFQAAAGMSLGNWYRLQLRRQMAAAGIPQPRDATFWPTALGILALALGGSLRLGARRQVR